MKLKSKGLKKYILHGLNNKDKSTKIWTHYKKPDDITFNRLYKGNVHPTSLLSL